MKTISLASAFIIASLVSPTSISAGECSTEEVAKGLTKQEATIGVHCPSFDILNALRLDGLTAASLQLLAPCKDDACLSALQQMEDFMPDCTNGGIHVKASYQAAYALCKAFADGDVTVAKAKELFASVPVEPSPSQSSAASPTTAGLAVFATVAFVASLLI